MSDTDDFLDGMGNEKELEKLVEQRDMIDQRIKDLQANLRGDALTKIKNIIDVFGLTQEDFIVLMPSSDSSKIKKVRKPRKAPPFIWINPDAPTKT